MNVREQALVSEIETIFAASGLSLAARQEGDEWIVDLVSRRTVEVLAPLWAVGPTLTLAVLAAEQRWLVEQVGSGSVAGATYVEKARERLRRWMDEPPLASSSV